MVKKNHKLSSNRLPAQVIFNFFFLNLQIPDGEDMVSPGTAAADECTLLSFSIPAVSRDSFLAVAAVFLYDGHETGITSW